MIRIKGQICYGCRRQSVRPSVVRCPSRGCTSKTKHDKFIVTMEHNKRWYCLFCYCIQILSQTPPLGRAIASYSAGFCLIQPREHVGSGTARQTGTAAASSRTSIYFVLFQAAWSRQCALKPKSRKFIDRHVVAGSTVNLCAVDLSKAFDKVNHHAMFIKLMERHVPIHLLELLENLFSGCYSYVKWYNVW